MIVCPNCNHQNPDGAVQCEACFTPLPAMVHCPSCSATVQADASFCGQCGFNLKASESSDVGATIAPPSTAAEAEVPVPPLQPPEPLVMPDPLVVGLPEQPEAEAAPVPAPQEPVPPPPLPAVLPVASAPTESVSAAPAPYQTQLQMQAARLLHVQSNAVLELSPSLSVIHMGKPNDRIPPDIDVSGFPNSEIVSRIHADIRVEGDAYYLEDVGSSNGTYSNNSPLPMGNRHRLRPGDRISLGKGDRVSFLFQLS